MQGRTIFGGSTPMGLWVSVFLTVGIALPLAGFFASPSATLATCAVSEGDDQDYKYGGFYYSGGLSGSGYAIRADLWNYNPSPVFEGTAFWVMWENSFAYAQVGWAKEDDDSAEYVFLQYTDEDGENVWTRYYNASTDLWVRSPATQPSSSKEYTVTWVAGSGGGEPHQFQFVYDGGKIYAANPDWEPEGWQVMAETLNFRSVSPTDKGDHAAGDTTNKIHADDIELYDTAVGWHDVEYYINIKPEGNHDTDTVGVTDTGFRVWDKRCAS